MSQDIVAKLPKKIVDCNNNEIAYNAIVIIKDGLPVNYGARGIVVSTNCKRSAGKPVAVFFSKREHMPTEENYLAQPEGWPTVRCFDIAHIVVETSPPHRISHI